MANVLTPLVIDCSTLCYRGFFSGGKDLSYEEKTTGVIFNFLLQVFKYAKDFDTKKIVFCWDSGRSFRKDFWPEYKKKRQELSEEEKADRKILFAQIAELRQKVIPNLGFKNSFIQTGYEADDLIAETVINNPGGIVISGDKDLYQLLDHCSIYLGNKDRFSLEDFREFYDIEPDDWAFAKSMGGCDSDGVKGIKGVADPAHSKVSKALSYIRGELNSGVVFDRIESDEGQEIIVRNLKLVELPWRGDLEINLDWDENFKLNDWIDVFNQYNFKSFMEKKYLNKLKEVFELK